MTENPTIRAQVVDCMDCGEPIGEVFVRRGLRFAHAECEIKALRKQRDTLLAVVKRIREIGLCEGYVVGVDLDAAIAACEEKHHDV